MIEDLILSGIVYVILTYLAFRLMKKRNLGNNNDDGGQEFELSPPKIDLPPGISWPSSPQTKQKLEKELN